LAKQTSVHVVPRSDGWAVRKEGNSRVVSTHSTQHDAIDAARKIARSRRGELIIHRSDGRIADRDSYSLDPFPPKSARKVLFHEALNNVDRKAVQDTVDVLVRKSPSDMDLLTPRRGWQHVVPHENGWAVKEEGKTKPSSIHNTQREAIEVASERARRQNGELFIHSRNGKIRRA
jgi:hypothetical protein